MDATDLFVPISSAKKPSPGKSMSPETDQLKSTEASEDFGDILEGDTRAAPPGGTLRSVKIATLPAKDVAQNIEQSVEASISEMPLKSAKSLPTDSTPSTPIQYAEEFEAEQVKERSVLMDQYRETELPAPVEDVDTDEITRLNPDVPEELAVLVGSKPGQADMPPRKSNPQQTVEVSKATNPPLSNIGTTTSQPQRVAAEVELDTASKNVEPAEPRPPQSTRDLIPVEAEASSPPVETLKNKAEPAGTNPTEVPNTKVTGIEAETTQKLPIRSDRVAPTGNSVHPNPAPEKLIKASVGPSSHESSLSVEQKDGVFEEVVVDDSRPNVPDDQNTPNESEYLTNPAPKTGREASATVFGQERFAETVSSGYEKTQEFRPTIDAASSTSRLSPSHDPQINTAKVIGQIGVAVKGAESSEIEIRLDPPELGRMKISIETTEHGTRAVVMAERAETQDLLRRQTDILARELEAAGFEGASVEFAMDQGFTGENSEAESQTGNENRSYALTDEMTASAPTFDRARMSVTGLDIRL